MDGEDSFEGVVGRYDHDLFVKLSICHFGYIKNSNLGGSKAWGNKTKEITLSFRDE